MRRLRTTLAGRLFLSYLLVILVGLVTMVIAANSLAPAFFSAGMAHMMAGRGMGGALVGPSARGAPMMDPYVQAAFRQALNQALLVAVVAATVTALLLNLLVARYIARPIQAVLRATQRIAAGHSAERVAVSTTEAADELAQLAAGFNAMAHSLEEAERRRLELVGDVAHELRTPVATLEGYLEGLLDGVVAPSDHIWAKLHGEAGRLRRLIDDLQEVSRAEARQLSLTVRAVPPGAIVQAALDRMQPQFEEQGLALESRVPSGLPAVAADQDRAVQVLTNLLTNALRYTPAPGHVELSVERAGAAVKFAVRDSGIGFTPEQGRRLFERFYRAEKSRSRALGGSGIGLTIARALVEAMGGHIGAESPGPGQGSTFAFTLPIARERRPLGLSES
ncbi:MAG: ATP-binding protein [Chloroflexi bacterium]|nr:ATP-binding protein [Chloroflexota bacterium]